MKKMNRILIPLLLSTLLLTLLILAGCRGANNQTETAAQTETKPEVHYEFLTGVELQTGETPVLLLPSDETTETFTATGDGTTTVIDLSNEGNPPSSVTEVKVDGEVVPETSYSYDASTGQLTFEEAPAKDTKIEIEAKVPSEETPPATSEPTPASSDTPASSSDQEPEKTEPEPSATEPTPTWTGAPETPIIPYKPQGNESDD